MIKKVWVANDKYGYFTAFLKEPEYVRGCWCNRPDSYLHSMGICSTAAKFLCGKQLPKPGECIEVRCSPGDLWIGL